MAMRDLGFQARYLGPIIGAGKWQSRLTRCGHIAEQFGSCCGREVIPLALYFAGRAFDFGMLQLGKCKS